MGTSPEEEMQCSYIVAIANVPHDHIGSGASRCIAIRGSWRKDGRAEMEILQEAKDSFRAMRSLYCM